MKKNLFKICYFIFTFALAFWFFTDIAKADTATTTIRLQIKTNDASLYDQSIDVIACADSVSASTTSVNAKCAVEQSGIISDFGWWGDDIFLNSLGGYVNNDAGNGVYWAWFSDLEYGLTALNKHMLANGEELLLTYNINPLKISTDNASPYVNATSTITVEQFGLDASWNPAWSLAASSALMIGGEELENVSGIYEYTATTTAPILIYGKKSGYINSAEVTITAQARQEENNSQDQDQPSGGGIILPPASGGGSAVVPPLKVDLGKAIDFLIAKQGSDGSFGAVLQSDWAAIALASANSNGSAAQKIKNYLLADPDPLAGMNLASDYSRRAMALMSLNINPYNGVKTNYINKIIDLFDGQQFGDASLYNDDIFALLVLSKAGYAADEEVIKKTADFIIAKQQADGSWGSSDLTAAAIQALASAPSLSGVAPALQKARNFLLNAQGADGGFGSTYATAWAMQALAALGESSDAWQKNNNTPESYLALSQGADGGLEKENAYEANRLWSTAYAIPAAQGKPWLNIMQNFSKLAAPSLTEVPADNIDVVENEIATSTLEKLDIATSSPKDLITASSTESLLQAEANEEKARSETVKTISVAVKPVKQVTPKVLSAKITSLKPTVVVNNIASKKSGQEMAENKTASTTINNVIQAQAQNNGVIVKVTAKEKINAVAKKALYVAGAGAIIAGIFLGLKLLLLLL
ncbi:MAG: prenyltransferase/squalene oxidase repeat-containing protein [Patescibacteria group bacterium]|jgi:hypothetical protein